MFEVREKPQLVERAILIGFYFAAEEETEARQTLQELAELVSGLNIPILSSHLFRVRDQNKKFLCGTGRAEEIKRLVRKNQCDCVVFDNMLAPFQQRTWENYINTDTPDEIEKSKKNPLPTLICQAAVIDREEVILDIFAKRARTREAQLQVELARMQYALPRLAKMWRHLDRQGGSSGGGAGAARGEGEKQIEVDRRLARNRIELAQKELVELRKQRATQRKERERQAIPNAAIVGYTNAGKSTLLNHITGSEVMAKDMLFATLDTTTRKIELEDGQPLLLTDTVGFIRNLPHRLIESFKATLEEAVFADFLIHVVDASSPDAYRFFETTLEVLHELGADNKRMITVLNKIDLVESDEQKETLANYQTIFPNPILVSSFSGVGIDTLLAECQAMLNDRVVKEKLRIPQTRGDILSIIYRDGKVISTDYDQNDILIECIIPRPLAAQLAKFHCAE